MTVVRLSGLLLLLAAALYYFGGVSTWWTTGGSGALLVPRQEPPLRGRTGHIIALVPEAEHVRQLAQATATHLLGTAPRVWQAVNGTEAAANVTLPLYTRMTLAAGRNDHMQLGSAAMLGCLLSHIAIWRHLLLQEEGEEALILEEDAQLDVVSAQRLTQLLTDVRDEPWDVLLLETGHLTVSGATRTVGELGRTWQTPGDATQNRWTGTRGYVLKRRGAEVLMRHADELDVQVDALLGMAVVFDGLRMVWPWANIAHPTLWRPSTVQSWDPCLKCFTPIDSGRYVLGVMVLMAAIPTLFGYYKRCGRLDATLLSLTSD
jgi:GR25 family glycosyltransferase involved in LPS biosynthesis